MSVPTLVALNSILPFLFILPPIILSSAFLPTGMLSPVSIDSSTLVCPFTTIPSTGIFSPGFTRIISPAFISSIRTSCGSPSFIITAFFGCKPINFFIAEEVFPFVLASRNFPRRIRVIITPADSKYKSIA